MSNISITTNGKFDEGTGASDGFHHCEQVSLIEKMKREEKKSEEQELSRNNRHGDMNRGIPTSLTRKARRLLCERDELVRQRYACRFNGDFEREMRRVALDDSSDLRGNVYSGTQRMDMNRFDLRARHQLQASLDIHDGGLLPGYIDIHGAERG